MEKGLFGAQYTILIMRNPQTSTGDYLGPYIIRSVVATATDPSLVVLFPLPPGLLFLIRTPFHSQMGSLLA